MKKPSRFYHCANYLFLGLIINMTGVPATLGNAPILTVSDCAVPDGYTQQTYPAGSFSHWVQHLPLTGSTLIHTHTGQPLESSMFHVLGVVAMPLLFSQDLEQCADFAMRFWAEYHKSTGQLDRLYLFNYDGSKSIFSKSGLSYANFLKRAFSNSNSHSLKQGCHTITETELMPGDVIVQNRNGGIGHVSMVMNACSSPGKEPLYLIGFSFMPAQEFHIESAGEYGKDGWFPLAGFYHYLRDHMNYGDPVLRRF